MLKVKYLVIAITGLLINTSVIAQVKTLDEFRKNPGLEINLRQDSTIEVIDKATNERYLKNIAHFNDGDGTEEADLILELDTVNFAYYVTLYRYWGKIELENRSGKYLSLDSNGDGLQEIYATGYRPPDFLNGGEIHKLLHDSVYTFEYAFIDTLLSFRDIGDINGDGLKDLIVKGAYNRIYGYKQNDHNSYINTSNFIYAPFPSVYQPNTNIFYDIDSDGILEMIYFLDAGDGDSVWAYSNHVAKFNQQANNYELVYYQRPLPDKYTYGISIGDFDQDGKGNFATGSLYGKFYIYEHVQGTQYMVELEDTLSTSNAYLTTFTDDMDGNGKPEVWIGGDFSSSTYGGVTRIYVFEPDGPGIYEQVFQIDIRGLFALTTGKMRYVDLDYDSEKELFLANGDFVFGIKNNGIGSYYFDFIKLLPLIDTIYTIQYIDAIDAADLDGDGISELISMHKLYHQSSGITEHYSVFYKRNKVTSINEKGNPVPGEYELFQNYPNPFNPETRIKFTLPAESEVSIKVYNILGKEIKELINESRISGEYELTWNGTDNFGSRVPSGIYFITMKAYPAIRETGSFQRTIKSVLLK